MQHQFSYTYKREFRVPFQTPQRDLESDTPSGSELKKKCGNLVTSTVTALFIRTLLAEMAAVLNGSHECPN